MRLFNLIKHLCIWLNPVSLGKNFWGNFFSCWPINKNLGKYWKRRYFFPARHTSIQRWAGGLKLKSHFSENQTIFYGNYVNFCNCYNYGLWPLWTIHVHEMFANLWNLQTFHARKHFTFNSSKDAMMWLQHTNTCSTLWAKLWGFLKLMTAFFTKLWLGCFWLDILKFHLLATMSTKLGPITKFFLTLVTLHILFGLVTSFWKHRWHFIRS